MPRNQGKTDGSLDLSVTNQVQNSTAYAGTKKATDSAVKMPANPVNISGAGDITTVGSKSATQTAGRIAEAKNAKVFVITNRKGGCGKSFTTASLGAGLARLGKKVLCIDTDNQHSLTISLGVKEPDKLPVSIATVITDIINNRDYEPTAGIIHHEEGMDFLPSNNSLTGIELSMAAQIGREVNLRKYISKVRSLYDYILIDTCPTMDLMTINALAAADEAIIPVTPKFLDAKGLELLLRSIAQVREFINPNLSISGILLTMVDKRTNFTKEVIGMIETAYGSQIHIFGEQIPHSVRAAEAGATGKSIFEHDPKGKVAEAYASTVQELLAFEGVQANG